MPGDDEVSADQLSSFTDPDGDERAHWQRVDSEALRWCSQLALMIGHKQLVDPLDKSKGAISRELSPSYDTSLSLNLALCILRRTQHQELARIIFCDGAGARMPEWQKRKVTETDDLQALKTELREMGAVGMMVIDRARRRARAGGK